MRASSKEQAEVDTIIAIVVVLLIAAILVPLSLELMAATSTSGWSASNILVWGLIGTVALAVIIIKFLKGVEK